MAGSSLRLVCCFHLKIRPVAQLVEYRSPKPRVGGSRPSWPASKSEDGQIAHGG